MMSSGLHFNPANNHLMLQERHATSFDQRRIQPQPTNPAAPGQPATLAPQRVLYSQPQFPPQQPPSTAASSMAQTFGMSALPVTHQQQLVQIQKQQQQQQHRNLQPNPLPNPRQPQPSFYSPIVASQPNPQQRPQSANLASITNPSLQSQNPFQQQPQQQQQRPPQQQQHPSSQFPSMNNMMGTGLPVSGLSINPQIRSQHPQSLTNHQINNQSGGPSNIIATPSQQAQRVESYANHPHNPSPGTPSGQQPSAPSQQPNINIGGPGGFSFGPGGAPGQQSQMQDRIAMMNAQSGHPSFAGTGLGITGPGSSPGGPINMSGLTSNPSNQPNQSQQQALRGFQNTTIGGPSVLGAMGIGPGPQNHPSPRHLQQQPHPGGPQTAGLGRPSSQPIQQQPFPHPGQQPSASHPQPPSGLLSQQHQSQLPQGPHHQPVLASSLPPSTPNLQHQQHPPPASGTNSRAGSVSAHTPRNPSLPPQTPQLSVQSQPPGPPPGFPGQQRMNRPPQPRSASLGIGQPQPQHPHAVGGPPPSGLPQPSGDPLGQPTAMGNLRLGGQYNKLTTHNIGSGQGVIRLMEFSNAMAMGGSKDLLYWQGVTSDYFVPDKGCMRMTLWKDEAEAKPFEIYAPTMPRFFHSYFNSGVQSISISLNGARETSSAPGESMIECGLASFTYGFHNGYVVVHTGPLRAHVLLAPTEQQPGDPSGGVPGSHHLKFNYVEFSAKKVVKQVHVDCIRSLVANGISRRPGSPSGAMHGGGSPNGMMTNGIEGTVNQSMTGMPMSSPGSSSSSHTINSSGPGAGYGDGSMIVMDKATMPSDPVNAFGIPQGTMRCLELAESVSSMADLIRLTSSSKDGPIALLRQFAENVRREHPDEPWAREGNVMGPPYHQQPQGRMPKNEPLEYSPSQFHQGPPGGMMHHLPPHSAHHLGPGTPQMMNHGSALMPPQHFQDPNAHFVKMEHHIKMENPGMNNSLAGPSSSGGPGSQHQLSGRPGSSGGVMQNMANPGGLPVTAGIKRKSSSAANHNPHQPSYDGSPSLGGAGMDGNSNLINSKGEPPARRQRTGTYDANLPSSSGAGQMGGAPNMSPTLGNDLTSANSNTRTTRGQHRKSPPNPPPATISSNSKTLGAGQRNIKGRRGTNA